MKIRKSNYILTLVTTSLVLFFLGWYLIIVLHSSQLVQNLKESANIVAELENDLSKESRDSILQFISKHMR